MLFNLDDDYVEIDDEVKIDDEYDDIEVDGEDLPKIVRRRSQTGIPRRPVIGKQGLGRRSSFAA